MVSEYACALYRIIIFSSTARRPTGLLSWQFVRRACVRASVNFFLVSTIETTFINQSMFVATRSLMSSIMSEIRPVTPDLLALKD